MTLRTAALLLTTLLATPLLAEAQQTNVQPFASSVKVGQKIWVTNAQGAEVRGEVAAVSSTALELATVTGAKRFTPNDVWMIHKKDSNKQGFWIGAGFGLLVGLVGAAEASSIDNTPEEQVTAFVIFSSLLYGGIGTLVDAAIDGRDLLYVRPDSGSSAVIKIAPVFAVDSVGGHHGGRVGLGGTIRWK